MKAKRIIPILLVVIMLGSTILGFLTTIIAYGEEKSVKDRITDRNVEIVYAKSVEKIDDYHYDLEIKFRLPGVKYGDVKHSGKPIREIDSESNKDDSGEKSKISLNNTAKDNCAFYNYTDAKVDDIYTQQVDNNPLTFTVTLKNAEYDGTGSTIELDGKFYVDILKNRGDQNSGTERLKFETDGYIKERVDGYYDKVGEDENKPDTATPYVIVSEYSIGADNIVAGSKFPLTIKFKNTHTRYGIENILMKVTVSDGLQLANSSNTFYIPAMDRNETLQQTLNISALPSAETKSHDITISFAYEYIYDHVRKSGTSEEIISIPVAQKDRFEIGQVELQPEIWPGEDASLEVGYVNKGKAQIYNLSATINGNIKDPSQYQYVGNVAAGGSDTIDFTIGSDNFGENLNGEVTITYEDANANVKTLTVPYSTKVVDQPTEETMGENIDGQNPPIDENMMPEEKQGLSTIQMVGIGVGALVVIIIIVKVVKTKRAKEFEDEDEDN